MSVETLDRLAAIVDKLTPLGAAGPGEPVRAADWNSVVAAVQDLAKVAIARERTAEELLAAKFAKAEHGHEGAANLAWFDAETRSLIEGDRSQRADLAAELKRTQRDLQQVLTSVDGLRQELDAVKRQIDEVDDRDRDRLRSVDKLAGRVEGLSDNTTSIADLRSSLGTIDTRVGEALAFRDELVDPQGQPVDIAVLRTDVTDLLGLRENLKAADGSLVEYRDFERRLIAVEESGPGGGPQPELDLDALRESLLADADEHFAERFTGIDTDLAGVHDDLADLGPRVLATEDKLTTQSAQITVLQTTTASVPVLTTRVNTLETRVAGHDTDIATMGPLRDRVTAAEAAIGELSGLGPRVEATEAGLADAVGRIDVLDGLQNRVATIETEKLVQVDDQLLGLQAAVIDVQTETGKLGDRVTLLESRAAELGSDFDRVETLSAANRQALDLMARDLQSLVG